MQKQKQGLDLAYRITIPVYGMYQAVDSMWLVGNQLLASQEFFSENFGLFDSMGVVKNLTRSTI